MKALAKIVFKIAGSIVLTFGCAGAIAATDDLYCFAPEISYSPTHGKYNEHICEGVRHIEKNDYDKAIRSFENAHAAEFFTLPNYRIFPRLAWLHFKTGNMEKAEDNLRVAELTLSIVTGVLKCKQSADGDYPSHVRGYPFKRIYVERAMKLMCNEDYKHMHENRWLGQVLDEARMVKHFLEIKEEIKGT